jgi:pyruvate dehydrogenase E1 component alpha subunit
LVEAYTYRMGAHTTSDDPTKYRLSEDLEYWKLKDPIERVKAYLIRTGAADPGFFDEIDAEAAAVAARLREGCLSMPDPALTDFFGHVYNEQTPQLAQQQEQYAAYAASFSDAQDAAGER